MLDKSKFKFKTQVQVRNFEIDWQGIVHNAVYLKYFEIGRIEYLKHLGIRVDLNTIRHDSKIVLARNEIDYIFPAHFDELLDVYSRVSFIKNTSFGFEGIIEESATKRLISENIAIHVWLNDQTEKPVAVHDSFKHAVRQYESGDVVFIT